MFDVIGADHGARVTVASKNDIIFRSDMKKTVLARSHTILARPE